MPKADGWPLGPVKHVAALLDGARDRLKWKRNVLPDAASRHLFMDHIAEITLSQNIALVRFDPQNSRQVHDLEELLGNLADEGAILGLEFHTSQ